MFMKTNDEVNKSGSADRRFCGLRLFHGGCDGPRTANTAVRATQNRGNNPGMYMKTKHNDKKSGSADRRLCGLRLLPNRSQGPRTANTAVRATENEGTKRERL